MHTFGLLYIPLAFLVACSTVPSLKPIKGETFELHQYTMGNVDNQTSISNGIITYQYGELCELDSRYSNRITVLGVSGDEVLLRYETDHPSPGNGNRNCITGVLFSVSLEKYDEMRSRSESFEMAKAKEKNTKKR